MMIIAFIIILLVGSKVEGVRVSPIMKRRTPLRPVTTFIATCAVGTAMLSTVPSQLSARTHHMGHLFSSAAVADSTGKMSTKLTAKKRYLPRIQKGIAAFRASEGAMDKEELESFVRALGLYGASLRAGEIPDAISRQADDLTKAFSAAASIKKMDAAQYDKCLSLLGDYLKFASLHGEDITNY